jgi:hypothetical protein
MLATKLNPFNRLGQEKGRVIMKGEGVVALARLPFLPTLLIAGNLLNQASARQPMEAGPRYPAGYEAKFEWDYSCLKYCSFSCPGTGGASHVTKLTIYLGTLQDIPALFYNFSTTEIPTGNGFIVSTDTEFNAMSCQINGMTLDYSGPAKILK